MAQNKSDKASLSPFARELFLQPAQDSWEIQESHHAQKQGLSDLLKKQFILGTIASIGAIVSLTRYRPRGIALRMKLMEDPKYALRNRLATAFAGLCLFVTVFKMSEMHFPSNPYSKGLIPNIDRPTH